MNSITTRTAVVSIYKENFVRMNMLENAILELEDMMDNHRAEQQVANGTPHVILIDTRLNSMSNDEARKFSSGETPTKYRLAVAILFEGLPGRIGANSLIKNYQPKVLTQTFDNEQKAIDWLHSVLEKKVS
ncbi:MAG: hypothetical protein V4580_12425 [Bacteroidota bacterium]